jgi:hypothetical protein
LVEALDRIDDHVGGDLQVDDLVTALLGDCRTLADVILDEW